MLRSALVALAAALSAVAATPSRISNFSTGWRYIPKDLPAAVASDFDDSSYEDVSVPHANIVTPHESFDPDMFRFVSHYRKRFRAGEELRGRRVALHFQGVMTTADVYLNGRRIGGHKGGYTGFTVELTGALNIGRENVVAVRVDSRIQKEVPPEGADKMFGFYLFGGIQRDVELIVTDPVHIETVYYNTVAIHPTGEVHAQIGVRNDTHSARTLRVRVRLVNSEGREQAWTGAPFTLDAGSATVSSVRLGPITEPKLWSPDQPNRYVAIAEVLSRDVMLDTERTWIGVRQIDWSNPDGQFRLNGTPLKLRGMNRHQTYAYIGGSAPNRLQRLDAQILKYQLGLNMVRGSHYPPDPQFLDECDRIGLLVMDEFPAWQYIGRSKEWQDNAVQAVREMIVRDRNHPSVILWGVRGNEASPRENDDRDLYARTYALVSELDPTRPPCGARLSDTWHGKMVPEEVLTINDYSDWDPKNTWPQPITGKPWFISEFGHPRQFPVWEGEGALLQFTKNWLRYLEGIYKDPTIAGGTGWAAFDYNSPEFNTPAAVTAHHCANDIFRLRKGFSAWALGSQADAARAGYMVRILSYWRRPAEELLVASNADDVEVLVNGKPLGHAKPSEFPHVPHPLFRFALESFAEGEVVARAFSHGELVATHSVRTPGKPVRLEMEPDSEEVVADGADLTRVVVYATDENGTICPYEDRRISIQVQNGRFLGENPVHLEGGRMAFYAGALFGSDHPVVIRATAEGLQPAQTQIAAAPLAGATVPLSDFDTKRIEGIKAKGRW